MQEKQFKRPVSSLPESVKKLQEMVDILLYLEKTYQFVASQPPCSFRDSILKVISSIKDSQGVTPESLQRTLDLIPDFAQKAIDDKLALSKASKYRDLG